MSENYEVQAVEFEEIELEPVEEQESKGGFGKTALLVGGGLALVGLVAAGVKKLKNKGEDKPKKQKTKLRLVRVPVEEETIEDVEFEEVEVE